MDTRLELEWYIGSWQTDIPDVISGQVHPQANGTFRGSVTFWDPIEVLLLECFDTPQEAAREIEDYIRTYMRARRAEVNGNG